MAGTKKETVIENPEEKLKEISLDIKKQIKLADTLTVSSEEEAEQATEFLLGVKSRINRIETLRKFFVNPLNEQVKKINAMFKEQSTPLIAIESKVKRAISDYRLEEERKARAEEERLRKIRERANEKREEKGVAPIETPVLPVQRAEATVKTESGRATTKKVWKFEIEAYSKLPQNVIDQVLYLASQKGIHQQVIRTMVNEGVREMSGVRIYEDFEISATAK